MKTTDIAIRYEIDDKKFKKFLQNNNEFNVTQSMFGTMSIPDIEVVQAVSAFKQYLLDEKERLRQQELDNYQLEQEKIAAEQAKRKGIAEMLITSGFSFDGYTVVKYSGYISGDHAVQVSRGREGMFSRATDVGQSLMDSLSEMRRHALMELKEQAYALGCNAVIGVDFDYITLEPETVNANGGTLYLPYVFGVTANGNAVIIEKK